MELLRKSCVDFRVGTMFAKQTLTNIRIIALKTQKQRVADYNKLNLRVSFLNYIFVLNIFIFTAIFIQNCKIIKSIIR